MWRNQYGPQTLITMAESTKKISIVLQLYIDDSSCLSGKIK